MGSGEAPRERARFLTVELLLEVFDHVEVDLTGVVLVGEVLATELRKIFLAHDGQEGPHSFEEVLVVVGPFPI